MRAYVLETIVTLDGQLKKLSAMTSSQDMYSLAMWKKDPGFTSQPGKRLNLICEELNSCFHSKTLKHIKVRLAESSEEKTFELIFEAPKSLQMNLRSGKTQAIP